MGDSIQICRASVSHLPAIVEIYNQAIRKRFATADIKEFSVPGKREWFQKHDDCHPLCVAVDNDFVLGWYSLGAYREGRQALSGVREVSYYVHDTHQSQGVGSRLMQHAIRSATELGVEHLVAIVLSKNERSIELLGKFHFGEWGRLPGIANFSGERCDHLYFGLKLSTNGFE